MKNPQIILSGFTAEEFTALLVQALRPIIQEEIKAALEKEPEQLLSPAEVCKRFVPKLSKTTLTKWADQGLIERHQMGGRTFYRLSEVLQKSKTLKRYKN